MGEATPQPNLAVGPRPIVELLRLALPTVAQMMSYTLMQFIDTWMLAHVGMTETTAAGNAGLFAFSVISFGIGVMYVVNTLASQSFGHGDHLRCGRYLWQGIWISIAYAVVLLPFIPLISPVFRAFGHEAELVRLEATYLHIVLTWSVFKLVGTALAQFLLATDRPGAVLASTVVGVSCNVVAAWIMLFGKLGVEPMGVAGAAWAQNIGVTVETAVLLVFVLLPGARQKFGALDLRPRVRELLTLLRIGVPAGFQFIGDVLAWSLFSLWVMAQFGTPAMAANTFMFRYMVVSFMPAFGIATAVTALVGRYIGMGRPDIAEQRAHLGFYLTAAYMLACGAIFFVGRNALIGVFTDDPEIRRIGALLLVFAAIYQLFDAMYIVYNGALRGAGDTLVPALATGILCWGITVFGGYAVAREFPHLGATGPWVMATAYGLILGVFMFVRFRRGRWRAIRLESPNASDTVPGFEVKLATEK